MSASKLHPKMYQGHEESAGLLSENKKRKNEKSPHYRGRVHLAGVGWFWVSGWLNENTKLGEIISLKFTELTDEEAEQYCAPKEVKKRAGAAPRGAPKENYDPGDSDIPF